MNKTIVLSVFLIFLSLAFHFYFIFVFILILILIIKTYPKLINDYHKKKMDYYCIDFFDTFIRHLKVGTSREQAFTLAQSNSHPFLQKQIALITNGLKNGEDFSTLLFNCAMSIKHKTLKHYLISIQTSIESGQSLLKQMEFLLRKVRKSTQLKHKLNSMVSQSKLQAYVCIALPLFFMLILYFLTPNFILPLFTQSIGKISLVISIILLSLGAYWINLIINKDLIQ
ncbi:MAG TPA: type II secretion system F family protein [Oligoflexia bacterium]|nr:type II secretion system F family protein [Oligoflexia bacterium]